jgi:hypothetical protein
LLQLNFKKNPAYWGSVSFSLTVEYHCGRKRNGKRKGAGLMCALVRTTGEERGKWRCEGRQAEGGLMCARSGVTDQERKMDGSRECNSAAAKEEQRMKGRGRD